MHIQGASSATTRPARADARRMALARRRARVLALVAAAVVVVTMASIGDEFAHAVETTSTLTAPALDRQYRINLAQFSCLEQEVRRDVPEGASVEIGPPTGSSFLALSEYLSSWAEPTSDGRATWRMSLSTGPCQGAGVVVVRVG